MAASKLQSEFDEVWLAILFKFRGRTSNMFLVRLPYFIWFSSPLVDDCIPSWTGSSWDWTLASAHFALSYDLYIGIRFFWFVSPVIYGNIHRCIKTPHRSNHDQQKHKIDLDALSVSLNAFPHTHVHWFLSPWLTLPQQRLSNANTLQSIIVKLQW